MGQVSGCQNNLEDGDPVTGIAFPVPLNGFTYHPEDLVFLPWFARESPSPSVNGWYTFLKYLQFSGGGLPVRSVVKKAERPLNDTGEGTD